MRTMKAMINMGKRRSGKAPEPSLREIREEALMKKKRAMGLRYEIKRQVCDAAKTETAKAKENMQYVTDKLMERWDRLPRGVVKCSWEMGEHTGETFYVPITGPELSVLEDCRERAEAALVKVEAKAKQTFETGRYDEAWGVQSESIDSLEARVKLSDRLGLAIPAVSAILGWSLGCLNAGAETLGGAVGALIGGALGLCVWRMRSVALWSRFIREVDKMAVAFREIQREVQRGVMREVKSALEEFTQHYIYMAGGVNTLLRVFGEKEGPGENQGGEEPRGPDGKWLN